MADRGISALCAVLSSAQWVAWSKPAEDQYILPQFSDVCVLPFISRSKRQKLLLVSVKVCPIAKQSRANVERELVSKCN